MECDPTGIDELDAKLSGDYPKDKGLLVAGVSGAGMTIFGLHLLHRSCRVLDNGQSIIRRVFEGRSSKSKQVTKGR